jgi:hypothetical protein
MPRSCRPRRTLALVCSCLAVFGASTKALPASDDPLLLFLASPSVHFNQGAGGFIDVGLTGSVRNSLPDGEAAVPEIAFDPGGVTASYRRIDQSVRPWVPLKASTPQAAQPDADGAINVSLGSIPATPGATYEVRVGVADAISWKSGAPTPAPAEFNDVIDRISEGACFEPRSAAEIVARARQTIEVLTIPSVAVMRPDEALAEAKRAFVGHTARVLRAGAGVTLDYSSPHACDRTVVLKRGESVKVLGIQRVDIQSATSVGPSGVPASAGLPPKAERHAPNAVMVSLAESNELESDPTLVFASTDELRQYLAPQ